MINIPHIMQLLEGKHILCFLTKFPTKVNVSIKLDKTASFTESYLSSISPVTNFVILSGLRNSAFEIVNTTIFSVYHVLNL